MLEFLDPYYYTFIKRVIDPQTIKNLETSKEVSLILDFMIFKIP